MPQTDLLFPPTAGMRLTQCDLLLQLRLSKVSELIHNSTNHQNLDSASVMVHFARINDMVRLPTTQLLMTMFLQTPPLLQAALKAPDSRALLLLTSVGH